ncbi:MAG: hypothetical protein PUB10_02775, partial [Clostridiales bacterium]|nr:hypothetical protein [Clostridiales bacterium]
IYWKLASYYSETDKRKAANDNYSKAIQICHKINNSITLKYIGFAVELEQYAYALKNSDNSSKKIKSSLQAHYENMRSDKAFDNMKDLFGDFSNNLSEKWMVYYDMSRRVSY